ncbi:MAG: hypothetical protein MJK14_28685 [Rivularia sp. ALOHA_DT_140]|nr:hypothetical protein [Rivularia sp. ALOHA_DT_140]
MNVISKNSEHLVLQKQVGELVYKIKILITTLGFILLFFICWMIFHELTTNNTLECNRLESTQVSCQINHQSPIYVTQAIAKDVFGDKSYYIQLYSNNDKIVFGHSYNIKTKVNKIVEKINNFINNRNLYSLSINQGKDWWNISGLIGFLFFPFLIIRKMIWRSPISSPLKEKWYFDIQQRNLIITKYFEKNKIESQEYSLSSEIKVQQVNQTDENNNISHEVKITLDSGESLELYSGNNQEKAENIYSEINSFINSNNIE